MSCDNIQGNGEVAHKMIGAFARLKDPELGQLDRGARRLPELHGRPDHAGHHRRGPGALAERFGVEDGWPVVCEPFTQWALEDRFPLGPAAVRGGRASRSVPDVGRTS